MPRTVLIESENGLVSGLLQEAGKEHVFLLVHGFQASKETKQFDMVESSLNDRGVSTLRIDQFGHGDDAERFEALTVTAAVASVKAAIDHLKSSGYKNIGLLGSSFGGLTSFLASYDDPSVSLLILKSPVLKQQGTIIARFKNLDVKEWQRTGTAHWEDKLGAHRLSYDFYTDANDYDVNPLVDHHSSPILIVHGSADDVVPAEQCTELKGKEGITVNIIESAKHKFTDEQMRSFVSAVQRFVQEHWFSS